MSFLSRMSSASRLSRVSTTAPVTNFVNRFTTIIEANSTSGETSPHAAPAPGSVPDVRPHHVVVSISGRDRPGIVKSVSKSVAAYNANLEESKMAILGGDFAMILYVCMKEAADADRLANNLRIDLPAFTVSVRETTAPTPMEAAADAADSSAAPLGWTLSLEGPDNPGIMAALSEALALHGCNVREMDTATSSAPFAGYELFTATSKLTVDESKLGELSDALNRVEEQFGSTISLFRDSN